MKKLKDTGFDKNDIVRFGNKYLIGNGYIGCRGTLDEFTKEEFAGVNVAGVYDGVPGKWRENLNVFNPLYMVLCCDGEALDVRNKNVRRHEISLDLTTGEFFRTTVFKTAHGEVKLETSRFVSYAHRTQIFSRTKITAGGNAGLSLRVAVDPDVWELNGPHYKNICKSGGGGYLKISAVTQELGVPVSVECRYSAPVISASDDGFGVIEVTPGEDGVFVLDRVADILVGGDTPVLQSYDEALADHLAAWKSVWDRCRVKIYGDARADFALAYSIYHLLILAPKGDYSIAARGLSGQTYKGAVFWDTEMFMLPFYLTVLPECAKGLVRYRINTLPQAVKKAESYGYGGAFYAWESQNGYDACSDFNVTDVFTHRPVRTYFKDKQIHISADIAYGILLYYSRTGDDEIMLGGGLKTVLMCAEFARTYSYYNHIKKRYELLDVIGPDEYHERVNNNAYTNYMFWKISTDGIACAAALSRKFPHEYASIIRELPENIIENLKAWTKDLYLPVQDENGIIEQFDGYFSLEDVTVEEVRARLVDPREYWGGSGGVATATRVIKQADVIMLFNLYPDLFSTDIQRANYNFYSRYTEHGSSLSRCSYALTACRVGMGDSAYADFLRSAETDLDGESKQWAGEVYIGGTHPAASGGAWQTAVCGFCGLHYNGNTPGVSPILPAQFDGMTFKAYDGARYRTFHAKRSDKRMIKAIIFDLDGVICSTDEYHYMAWKTLAENIGITDFSRKDNERQRGVSRMQSLEVVLEKSDRKYTDEEKSALAEEKNEIYKKMLLNMSPADLSAEVKSTLDELRARGLKLAIGSASKNTPTILNRLGLGSYFDAVADGNCITHSKPDPEVFLKAAEMLGLKPSECIVVEDAAAGIQAGKNGGFYVAGIGAVLNSVQVDFPLKTFSDLLKIDVSQA